MRAISHQPLRRRIACRCRIDHRVVHVEAHRIHRVRWVAHLHHRARTRIQKYRPALAAACRARSPPRTATQRHIPRSRRHNHLIRRRNRRARQQHRHISRRHRHVRAHRQRARKIARVACPAIHCAHCAHASLQLHSKVRARKLIHLVCRSQLQPRQLSCKLSDARAQAYGIHAANRRIHIMLVRRLQRLRRIAVQIQRSAQRSSRSRQQAPRQLRDRLVYIRLAHRLHSLRRRHHLRLHLSNACLRRHRNHPVFGARRSVAHLENRRIIQPRRRRSHIGRKIHAQKSIRRDRHHQVTRRNGLPSCRSKCRPAHVQCSRAGCAVRQVHRPLDRRRARRLRTNNTDKPHPHKAESQPVSQPKFQSHPSACAEPIVHHELHPHLFFLPENAVGCAAICTAHAHRIPCQNND